MELGGQYAELYSLQASHYSAAGSYGTRLTTTG